MEPTESIQITIFCDKKPILKRLFHIPLSSRKSSGNLMFNMEFDPAAITTTTDDNQKQIQNDEEIQPSSQENIRYIEEENVDVVESISKYNVENLSVILPCKIFYPPTRNDDNNNCQNKLSEFNRSIPGIFESDTECKQITRKYKKKEYRNSRGKFPYKCFICKHRIRYHANYRLHLLAHDSTNLKYECGICGKGFLFPSKLRCHQLTHSR